MSQNNHSQMQRVGVNTMKTFFSQIFGDLGNAGADSGHDRRVYFYQQEPVGLDSQEWKSLKKKAQ